MAPVENPFAPARPQLAPRRPIGLGVALATAASFAVLILAIAGALP